VVLLIGAVVTVAAVVVVVVVVVVVSWISNYNLWLPWEPRIVVTVVLLPVACV
jgi:hypothetical protein